ncbi:hypothetical protein CAOG_06291 [Capsaspora owczarzaki ATCC 30864]|uniref:NADH dehydrogenase [ubiquinone] 1 alpha subcomplex subunit 7 n=1 Tax=Capsaspora owczarzaki (strain ATCC 30864) TaxID=595528 RepID=A0A0D2VWE8_CAPO3|nr:hypothetical protein CAOG_06291 [Capsaspora owczarzaki ATCC 30864]KJE95897.1 hypothetical protein CAOG_006291 [Capsaspora owczarzaki ATCC 30864]|eukprot:XP_004345039.1 hypothetical protein CAOG_06291 [Capsaspora owczarzaki ATCC 30864]
MSKVLAALKRIVTVYPILPHSFRYQGVNIVSRSQPLPNLPPGVAHKLSKNYYWNRDDRRAFTPSKVIGNATSQPLLTSETAAAAPAAVAASSDALPPVINSQRPFAIASFN